MYMKKVLYLDLDGTLVDFQSGIDRLPIGKREAYRDNYDDTPGIFSLMDPMPGGVEAFLQLAEAFDTYILSTAPWNNPSAWSDKLLWVKEHLGEPVEKRLILSHHKNLNHGDYLVDDRPTKRGVERFNGEVIHFRGPEYPDWASVVRYLLPD
uniref:5 nucleotidase, deoxy, cytosolic type C n=1 Tax=Chlorobium phaeovibrioides (strain DSM 265 / 1930) TaxID=290318 RepID=A4SCD2_CHLPM